MCVAGGAGQRARADHLLRGRCRGPGTVPDAAAPGTERAPSHFLFGIQNARADTGGPRPRAERLPRDPRRVGMFPRRDRDENSAVCRQWNSNPRPTKPGKVIDCVGCGPSKRSGISKAENTLAEKRIGPHSKI